MKTRRHRAILAIATLLTCSAALFSTGARAQADWQAVEAEARGQTVYFNAWGGGEAINAYVGWAADTVRERYGVTVRHVKVADIAEVVKRVQTEIKSGRTDKGSVDLMWVNGENFRNLKQAGLLFGPWAEALPNWALVDQRKPVRVDFSVPTDGLEAPWGTAQLTFIADRATTPVPPRSATELLSFAKANPGRVTYPKLPDFHGTTFVKQMLLELAPDAAALQQPVTPEAFTRATEPLWSFLDQLHPALWRQGKAFPASAAEMHRMLGDGELKLSLTFNPNEAANLIVTKQLPQSAYSFGFAKGTIGNVHFLAIPANASAKAGARLFANFLLSPEAQARKADVALWGDGSVLDAAKLPEAMRAAMSKTAPGALAEHVPTLAEPHASWVESLEAAWLRRYGTR
jgi:putative thiamine transport system substrate-binding protein